MHACIWTSKYLSKTSQRHSDSNTSQQLNFTVECIFVGVYIHWSVYSLEYIHWSVYSSERYFFTARLLSGRISVIESWLSLRRTSTSPLLSTVPLNVTPSIAKLANSSPSPWKGDDGWKRNTTRNHFQQIYHIESKHLWSASHSINFSEVLSADGEFRNALTKDLSH